MRQNPDFDFRHLDPSARVRLALDLWESLDEADREAASPLTEAQAAELDRRVDAMDRDGDPGQTWEEVLEGIRAEVRLRQRGA